MITKSWTMNASNMKPKEVFETRMQLAMSRKELAFWLGVNYVTIAGWENGKRNISKDYRWKLLTLKEEIGT